MLTVLFFTTFSLLGADAFVTAEYVQENLGSKKLVLIDVGCRKDFLSEGHIPGAQRVNIKDWRAKQGKHQLIQSSSKLEKIMRKLGVNNDSHVVIYGHNKTKEVLKSSYIALAFIVNGHKNVSILNGGLGEWKYEGDRKLSYKITDVKKGNFKAQFKKDVLVNKDYVLNHLHKIAMIEARPPQFYFGVLQSKGVKREGHIPGAMSYYWKNSFESDETVLETETLKKILIEGMQLNPKKKMLAYCTGGLEASMNWYILTQVLKFKDVKIYDASMREWGNDPKTPIVRYRWENFNAHL